MSVYKLPTKRQRLEMLLCHRLAGCRLPVAWMLTVRQVLEQMFPDTVMVSGPSNANWYGCDEAPGYVVIHMRACGDESTLFRLYWCPVLCDYDWRPLLSEIRRALGSK